MWLEGVSIWPNLAIRLVGVLVIMYFSNYFYFKLRYHKRIISRVYFPDSIEQKNLADKSKKELNPQMFFITNIWQSYLNATSPVKLTLAIFLFATLALVITFFIFQHFGQVNFPYRGGIVLGIHYALLWLQYIFLWGLVFWFYFEAIACINFINAANDSHCEWPVKVLDELESDTGISKTYLDRYTQFQVIAQVTEFVGRLIYLPFGMMLIILLERSKIIDQLGVPFSLILIFLTIAVISLYLMYKMRVSAEKARDNILKFYMLKSRKIEFSKEKDDIAEIQINRVIRLINNTQMGIYASVHHQPFAAALLIPFGGMGGMQIIENLFGIQ